jgi:hypothetical protein
MSRTLPARPSLEQLQKQAKELLRAQPELSRLSQAQFALAREYGFDTWAALKHRVQELQPSLAQYEQLARDLAAAYAAGDPAAIREINWHYGTSFSWDHDPDRMKPYGTLAEAQQLVAHAYEFANWEDFAASVHTPPQDPHSAPVFMSAAPPFYKIDWQEGRLWARGPQTAGDWARIFDVMAAHGIAKLSAGGIVDEAMPELARLDHITHLQLESKELTDEGAKHLAGMPQLLELEVGGWTSPLTDRGLECLAHLTRLRRFTSCWTQGVTDQSLSHLRHAPDLEHVNLMGTPAGDGTIRALMGKVHLTHFSTGRSVTDAGIDCLREFPIFATWRDVEIKHSLMNFQAEANHLMLDGPFTDAGLARLAGLDGLVGLSFFWHCPKFTSAGLTALRHLPRLEFLGCQGQHCDDEAMRQIANMPGLKMLMGQGSVATDEGFRALSRLPTLEFLWGRECPNLGSSGFAALADVPALRGLAVSCKNVDDAALSRLPQFPALRSLMPMDVTDDGFRHVGQCRTLEDLICMYCRETGDIATSHLSGLASLKSYYAGKTQITDESLSILGQMTSLEKLEFWQCAGLTDAGVAHLSGLPRLRDVALDGLPRVTQVATRMFPAGVRVRYTG